MKRVRKGGCKERGVGGRIARRTNRVLSVESIEMSLQTSRAFNSKWTGIHGFISIAPSSTFTNTNGTCRCFELVPTSDAMSCTSLHLMRRSALSTMPADVMFVAANACNGTETPSRNA